MQVITKPVPPGQPYAGHDVTYITFDRTIDDMSEGAVLKALREAGAVTPEQNALEVMELLRQNHDPVGEFRFVTGHWFRACSKQDKPIE